MNWRPISEKPELEADGFSKPVLLFMEDYSAVGFWTQRGHWMVRGMKIVEPTHWCEITPPAEPVPQDLVQLIPHDGKSMADFLSLDAATKRLKALRGGVAFDELYAERSTPSGRYQALQADTQKVAYAAIQDLAALRREAERCDDLAAALSDLYAMVNGECPSLLNEDSGGNAELDLRIAALLAQQKKRAAVDALPDPAE